MKTNIITENLIRAIIWADYKFFDPSFQSFTVQETAIQGFDVVVKSFSNYFESIVLIETNELPKNIAESLGSEYAILTEENFIYADGLVVKTDLQFFTSKTLELALKNKKAYLIKRTIKKEE